MVSNKRGKTRQLITPSVELVLLNIRSRFNVGAIFRTADAVGISRIHLVGYTPKPPHREIDKVSLGAEKTVPFSIHTNPLPFLRKMKDRGYVIIAVETSKKSVPYYSFVRPNKKVLMIVGHEIKGIDASVLKLCDHTLAIPMRGYKESLNVGIALGIVAYRIAFP
jgi:tRNA G18 (ribose-2'-O)-methylase SpoU